MATNKPASEKFVLETIADLRDAMSDGFDEVDKHFDQIDKRFETVDIKFREVDHRFDEVDKRFDILESKMNQILNHVVSVAGQFQKFDEERVVIVHHQRDHERRLQKLEKVVASSI